MILSIVSVDYAGGTIATAVGLEEETGDFVTFGGDARPMSQIAEALAEGEDVEVEIEDWQVLARTASQNVEG